jgi:hypothetical protein
MGQHPRGMLSTPCRVHAQIEAVLTAKGVQLTKMAQKADVLSAPSQLCFFVCNLFLNILYIMLLLHLL